MIPLRVQMRGWMRYRDEQVADFTGGNLIAICGENGAGKSAIFDAITYALFGRHRLGAQHTEDLISQDEDLMSITFDFEANGDVFRILRSRGSKPGSGALCLYRIDPETDKPVPIPGTDRVEGLQAAINKIVKLSDVAFTSSYLLPQDQATQFIDLKPNDRFKAVSGLIGLEAYEALVKAATDAGRAEEGIVKDRGVKLLAYEGVSVEAVELLKDASQTATKAADTAAKVRLAAELCDRDAGRYAALQAALADLDRRIAEADKLIAGRDAIERDATLFQQYDSMLKTVNQIVDELRDATGAEATAATLREQVAALDLGLIERQAQEAEDAVALADQASASAAQRQAAAVTAERQAHDFHTAAEAYRTALDAVAASETRVASFEEELQRLPELKAEVARLLGLRDALPDLQELARAQISLEQAESAAESLQPQRLEKEAKAVAQRVVKLVEQCESLEKDTGKAQTTAAHAQAEMRSLDSHLAQRRESADEAVCSHCGQPIDPERASAEIEELHARLDAVCEDALAAATDLETVAAALEAARLERRDAESVATQLGLQLAEARSLSQRVDAARAALTQRQTALTKRDLSATLPGLAAATPMDIQAAIETVTAETAGLQAAQSDLNHLLGLDGQLTAARQEQAVAAQSLARVRVTVAGREDEAASAAAEHQRAKAELADANAAHETLKAEAQDARRLVQAAAEALRVSRAQRQELEASALQVEAAVLGHKRTAEALSKVLPGDLPQRSLSDSTALAAQLEADRLAVAEAPRLLEELRRTQGLREGWAGEHRANTGLSEAIPIDHRVDPAQATAELAAAVVAEQQATHAARESEAALATAKERLAAKGLLVEERARAEKRLQRFKRLGVLLGRNGLQGVLVTESLATITSHANSFLERLTGGSLQLILERSKNGDMLDLLALDATAMREPRRIEALSGSQKFRCAVALAFGIGQYSGAGGMRSIMIDEGFGGLDESGQRQMVDELKNLAQHMDKVIVVSHLEAFRDPDNFPDQIFVEKQGNASIIRVPSEPRFAAFS